MCGRYVATRPADQLADLFAARDETGGALKADYNVAPTKPVPAVLARPDRRHGPRDSAGDGAGDGTAAGAPEEPAPLVRRLRVLRWGLVPGWARDPRIGSRLINARAETLAVKPAFRRAFAARRCLLPADGWYEWEPAPGGGRQPWFLHESSGGLLALAGLYEIWADAEGGRLWTATVVTTAAADDLGHLHDRAPMIIPPRDWDAWLDPATQDPGRFLRPAVAGEVAAVPVSTRVNDVRNEGPDLVEPVEAPRDRGAPPAALF